MKTRKEYLEDYIQKIEEFKKKINRFQNPQKPSSFRSGYLEELDYLETYLKLIIEDKEEAASDHYDYASGVHAAFEWFEDNIHHNRIEL